MPTRVVINTPRGEVVTRDIAAGRWDEPGHDADDVIGDGLWGLPGLVDAHSHIPKRSLDMEPTDDEGAEARAREALRAGVTLLLDKGWMDDTAVRLIDRLPPDERPDIEAAVRLLSAPGGYYPGVALELEPGDLEAAVIDQARRGEGWVKLIGDWPRRGVGPVANFTEEELDLAVITAESEGARVAIHTMARGVPSMAVRAGVHSIEHGLFLTDDDIEMLGARGGMWVPTLLRVERTITELGPDSSGGRLLGDGLENVKRLMGDAVDAGVRLLAGTDLVGTPASVAFEALKLAEYGLSADMVIDAVSMSGLDATGRAIGYEVGAPADAVFFRANPLEEPSVLVHPALVIRHGRIV
jgi:imidazolonepropionase-like amidohydrolase